EENQAGLKHGSHNDRVTKIAAIALKPAEFKTKFEIYLTIINRPLYSISLTMREHRRILPKFQSQGLNSRLIGFEASPKAENQRDVRRCFLKRTAHELGS